MRRGIAQSVDAKVDDESDVSILDEATRSDKVQQQIDESIVLQDRKDAKTEPALTSSSTR